MLNKYDFNTLEELTEYLAEQLKCEEYEAIPTLFVNYAEMVATLKRINDDIDYIKKFDVF